MLARERGPKMANPRPTPKPENLRPPWPPGTSGNPAGYSRGRRISDAIERLIEEMALGPDVWGTCTFHEYTARCPNPAPTVRAHNWVVLGALLDNPGQPPWCLPLSGRLYFRKSQLPLQAQDSDHTVVFRTKCELVVELIREQARITALGGTWGSLTGPSALRSVVRPLVQPEPGTPASSS